MRLDLKAPGVDFDPATGFNSTEIIYKLADDKEVTGYGQFFTEKATRTIIETYWNDLKLLAENSNIDDNHVAIDMGKEMLLMILSQPGCEGIRIYYARGIKVDNSTDTPQYTLKGPGENTLVAVGIDHHGNELSVQLPNGIELETRRNVSFLAEGVTISNDTMRSETNPPLTYKAITQNPVVGEPFGIADAFKSFLAK